MSWRFRKSVKIAPGTRVNFSRRGVSMTNRVGKTGLYHRTQLVGGQKRRSKSSEPGCLGRSFGIVAALFVLAAFVYVLFQKFLELPPHVIVLVLVLLAVVVGLGIWKKTRSPAEERAAEVRQEKSGKAGEWSFVLARDEDPEKQKQLKALKLEIEADGYKGERTLVNENGAFYVRIGEQTLGQLQPADAEWAAEHFEEIEKLRMIHIYGGDRDVEDNPRPLTVKVWADLKPGTTGPQLTDVDLPDPQINTFFAKGDTVVYVSPTGKIHLSYGCGVSISNFKPMLYQDAIDAGCEECSKCFR